ncbi:MAG: ribosome silencing factor [Hyphomicrobium sp.]
MIRSTAEGARKRSSSAKPAATMPGSAALLADVMHWLDDAKAEEIVDIPLEGKSSLGDYMVVATGRSDRHVGAIAEQVALKLKEHGVGNVRVEGLQTCDWVLIDAGDIIIHVFRPEVRAFYNIEKMWQADVPGGTGDPQH